MPDWYTPSQRALLKARRAGIKVFRRVNRETRKPLNLWEVESATHRDKRYDVRVIDGRWVCTCIGGNLPMCLHRAAVMASLGVLSLDPPVCRNCHHRHTPGASCARCPDCREEARMKKTTTSGSDEYERLYGGEEV